MGEAPVTGNSRSKVLKEGNGQSRGETSPQKKEVKWPSNARGDVGTL